MTMNLDEISKLLGEATPGPWFAHATDDSDFQMLDMFQIVMGCLSTTTNALSRTTEGQTKI